MIKIINYKRYEKVGKHLLEITKLVHAWINSEEDKIIMKRKHLYHSICQIENIINIYNNQVRLNTKNKRKSKSLKIT